MADLVLRDWPDVIDVRTIPKEDSFQSSPFRYAVNSNQELYTGLDDVGRQAVRKRMDELWAADPVG